MDTGSEMMVYFGIMMAIAGGMTAWRLAVRVKVRSQVDGLLGLCLVLSTGLFFLAALPGGQLP